MATAVRHRVPFRFSEENEHDGHVLDEQEQDEVIESLRTQSANSKVLYLTGLQIVIGLSLFIHILYLFSPTKVSPLADLIPGSPASEPVPLATGLTLLHCLLHVNLSLNLLPPDHHYRKTVHQSLPFPLTDPATILLTAAAPVYSLVLGYGRADVIWWTASGIITALVALLMKWMRDGEKELAELEKLRYTVKGA